MIIVYSKPGCTGCVHTKTYLKSKGIEFVEKDITKDPEALDRVLSLGYQAVPVVEAGDASWFGHNTDRLAELHD